MNRLLKYIIIVYYVTHIPISLFFDLQSIFHKYYPEFLQQIYIWYCNSFKDPLMSQALETYGLHPWISIMIYYEILQIPYFFIATYAMAYELNWIRIPSIIYASHVVTTVSSILSEMYYSRLINNSQKMILYSFYVPYLLLPLLILFVFSSTPMPFEKNISLPKRRLE